MNPSTDPSESIQIDTSSLACIDGENLSHIAPLREFLEGYGITILENDDIPTECLYHIVLGTSKSVQEIFSRNNKMAHRRLALVWDISQEEAEILSKNTSSKVAVIDNRLLEQQDSRVIFGFLCTTKSTVLNLCRDEKISIVASHNKEDVASKVSENSDVTSVHPTEKNVSPLEKIDTSSKILTVHSIEDSTSHNQSHSWEIDADRINKTVAEIYQTKKKKKNYRHNFRHSSRFILLVILMFACSHIFSLIFGGILLYTSFKVRNHPNVATHTIKASHILFSYAANSFSLVSQIAPLSQTRTYERILQLGEKGSGLALFVQTFSKTLNLSSFVTHAQSPSEISPYTQLSQSKKEGAIIKNSLGAIRADLIPLEKELASFRIPIISTFINRSSSTISKLAETTDLMTKLSTVYPLLAPPNESKTYLVLFQNSMELRPTGGFIGSIGVLTFENGKMKDIQIDDVYNIDGQLKGHVDPPLPIRTLLQDEHWYLRNSNWDPDFTSSGEKAAWFYEKSTGNKTDGVIAISLPVIEDLLNATGPLTIPEVKEPITAANLFPTIHNLVEENFFPGSTQKKDILGSIFRRLFEKTLEGKGDPLLLVEALSQAISQKNIMIMSSDGKTNALLKSFGWAGSFEMSNNCTEKNNQCIADFFAPVEANLGVNKVNYAVNRSFKKKISVTSAGLSAIDNYIITNASQTEDPGGGSYTAYVQFFYPKETKITAISINDEKLEIGEASMSAKKRPYAEWIKDKPEFKAIGVAVDVPAHTESIISIKEDIDTTELSTYSFYFKKQPGIKSVPITIDGTMPENWKSTLLYPLNNAHISSFVAQPGKFEYTTQTDSDTLFSLSVQKP